MMAMPMAHGRSVMSRAMKIPMKGTEFCIFGIPLQYRYRSSGIMPRASAVEKVVITMLAEKGSKLSQCACRTLFWNLIQFVVGRLEHQSVHHK